MKASRRKFVKTGTASVLGALFAGRSLSSCKPLQLRLDNDLIGMSFEKRTGTLEAIENKLTGEIYRISGDTFGVEADEFMIGFDEVRINTLKKEGNKFFASYRSGVMAIDVIYILGDKNHFAEKKIILRCDRAYGLKKVVLSHSAFSASGLRLFPYRYPKFGREPGEEPCLTLFGRTSRGGFFAGVAMPFDASFYEGPEAVFAYPPRFGLVPMANGWHSEMEKYTYTEDSLKGDMKSLDFIKECGIDWV